MEFRKGYIDQIGDKDKDEEKGRYRVRLEDEDIVTGWLFLSKPTVKDNVSDYTLDLQTPVWVILFDEYRSGVIGGCINNKDNPQKETDPEVTQVFFKDESYVKYNRETHTYSIFIKGDDNKVEITAESGTVNITCKNATIKVDEMATIDGKLTVKDDVVFEKKLDVTGAVTLSDALDVAKDISTDMNVKAMIEVSCLADVLKLSTHKHPTAAPGPPSTPIL